MMKPIAIAALLLVSVLQPSAQAANCDGQKGKVIFEDDFSDDSGGWPVDRDISFGNSGMTVHIQDPTSTWIIWNRTFAATEGDFCLEAVLPKAAAPDIHARTGIAFLISDSSNFYLLLLADDNAIQLYRKEGENWLKLGDLSDPKLKPEPESVVALRAVVKANLITASINGIELKKQRAQLPAANLKFGIYVQTDKAIPAPGVNFQFKRYKVTAGQ